MCKYITLYHPFRSFSLLFSFLITQYGASSKIANRCNQSRSPGLALAFKNHSLMLFARPREFLCSPICWGLVWWLDFECLPDSVSAHLVMIMWLSSVVWSLVICVQWEEWDSPLLLLYLHFTTFILCWVSLPSKPLGNLGLGNQGQGRFHAWWGLFSDSHTDVFLSWRW